MAENILNTNDFRISQLHLFGVLTLNGTKNTGILNETN